MKQFYLLSFSVFSFFALLIHPANAADLITQRAADLVSPTCKQCADLSSIASYDYCVTSLQAIPISHVVNLPGLAVVAMELSLENATGTIVTIKEMIGSGAYEPFFAEQCLQDCMDLYNGAVLTVEEALTAFLTDHSGAADIYMGAVMEDAMTCEDGFKEMGGVRPLVKENENLYELSRIAVCIIKLVSSKYPPPPPLYSSDQNVQART